MSETFVQSLRTRGEPVRLAAGSERVLGIRVQIPELWDTVQVLAPETATVLAVKTAVLGELLPQASEDRYVMKLRGFEVLDEAQTLAGAEAIDGSIFLLSHRRRRPVR